MVTVVAFEFSVMRCQPLRRALGENRRSKCQYIQLHPKVCQLMPI
ncbi:acetyltransferase [Vibrio cholerae]|nr:acetyltransferase [Vibrio cholerae]EJL6834699.1 acetyltransferase [Vibrio cholerae]EKG0039319.1 acetyltransferase [Vibrio cholerae]EMC7822916.1 acetyltransferase [Vibrio cholerae]MCX9443536.1 acetyltransferase [Vibrio cholerae]MCX9447008.1 acetyltransferase [Vibrio cholerae]